MAISRAKLKGSPLGDDCKRANITTEYGKHLCYGLTYDPENGIYIDKCKTCKALVWNDPDVMK